MIAPKICNLGGPLTLNGFIGYLRRKGSLVNLVKGELEMGTSSQRQAMLIPCKALRAGPQISAGV